MSIFFAELRDDTQDLKVEQIWGGDTVALSKNPVFLGKWRVYMTREEISPWHIFPYSMTEVSQLCVWIWRLQLYGHRVGQRCDKVHFTGYFFV